MQEGDPHAGFERFLANEASVPRNLRAPKAPPLWIGGREYEADFVSRVLGALMTDARRARIESVISNRTYDIATVVEGSGNAGNVSAVMRTAEAFGFQPFHVVTGGAEYKTSSRTTQGAHKWLDVHTWPDPATLADYLRAEGYRILATTLSPDAHDIRDVDFGVRSALIFGNEQQGVSSATLSVADELVTMRTPGFVESFNISVAAAVFLYHAYHYRAERGVSSPLPEPIRQVLRAEFYLRSVRDAEAVLRRAVQA